MAKNPYLDMVEQGQTVNAASGGNPYLEMAEGGVARDNSAFKASATLAIEANPDEVARQKRIADLLKVPPAAVAALPEESTQQARMLEIEQATANAPALRRQFTREDFARLAHDDVENLAGIERTVGGMFRDAGVVAIKGAIGLPQAIVGLANIPTFGYAGKAVEAMGIRFADAQGFLEETYSPAQQAANKNVQQAEGFLDTMAAAFSNPSVIATTALESLPQMLGGAVAARGLLALGATGVGAGMAGPALPGFLARTVGASAAPLVAGAIGEGTLGAGAAAEQIRSQQEDGTLSPLQVGASVASGAGTALFSVLGGKLAQKLGVGDIDTALASGQIGQADIRKGLTRLMVEAGISEGVFEELPQSAQEQVWQNIAMGKPWSEGVGNASAMGLLAGAVTGSSFQGVQQALGRDTERADAAGRTAAGIEELNKLAAASKTLKRDAATVEQFVASATAEGADSVYIGGRELMQSGVGEALAQLSPAVAAQVQEAVATGGMVRIPLSEYTARIAPTEYAQQLVDYLKIDPEGFSRAEAREYLQTQGEQLKAEVEQVLTEANVDQNFRASQDALKQAVLANLNDAGRWDSRTNEFYAELVTARTSIRAAKLGMTPEALFAKDLQRLQVRAESPVGARVLNQEGGRRVFDFSERDTAPVGSWVREDFKTDTGQPISQVRDIAIDEFYLPELTEDGRLQPEKRGYLDSYAERARAGEKPPRITVIEMEDGRLRVTDGHRRVMAARAAGVASIEALVSPLVDTADGRTGATEEGLFTQSTYTADTIEVGGKTRPAVNNKGQRIAQTEEALRNFWRWFGDSKVVDEQGRPLVVNHATWDEFDTFDFGRLGEVTDANAHDPELAETARIGAWFADRDLSDDLAAPVNMQVYLSIKRLKVYRSLEHVARATKSAGSGSALRAKLVEQGFDGARVVDEEFKAISYVAFTPTQIKSATGNRGTFDGSDPNILNQSGVGQEPRDLYVGHNITAEKLRHALDLGGLPAPSLGVSRTSTGGFEGFGDITLLAPKEILESDGARTFNADVYSPRQPRPVYKPDPKAFDALLEKLRALPGGFSVADIDEVGRYGADALARSDAVKLLYLTETGQAPKAKQQKVPAEIKKAAKLGLRTAWQLREDAGVQRLAAQYYESIFVQYVEAGLPANDIARIRSRYFEQDGTVTFNLLTEFSRKVERFISEKGVDTGALRQDVTKKLRTTAQSDAFEQWVKDMAAPMLGAKKLELSPSRRVPYTLDNVTAQMIKDLRGGEGFNYGAGNIRAMFAAELDSVQAVQNRRNEIVSGADMKKAKDESQDRLQDTLAALKPFYKYDANGWAYMDDATRAIGEGTKGWREAFKINAESEKIIRDYVSYVKNLPTEYFETKMQRSVDLSEFTVAIVPKGTPQDVVATLEGKGLTIKTYDPKKDGARARAIAAQTDLLFQNKDAPRGSFNPDTTIITLLKGADLSTMLHELGHYFFEADIALASELVAAGRELTEGERSLLEDVSALFKWHGIQGTIEDQLRQWHTMSFEEQRTHHERTAESFEAYLFEGRAPSIELQPYFQKFRTWLTKVYTSLKDFLSRHPEAGKLDDTVRAIFDRMLATDEQIALAQQGRSMQAMFRTEADAAAVGMTPEEFARYQADDENRVADAAQDLQAKALRDLQWARNARAKEIKKLQRKSAEVRRDVRMAVRREVMSQPVYRAWQFLTSRITADDKVTAEALPKSGKKAVTPEVDSLFVAIAKLGGIAKVDAASAWGITDKIAPPVFGKPVLRATDGYSIDAMAEKLGELGYLTLDRDGKVDVREFEELFGYELRGDKRYSNQVDGRVVRADAAMPGEGIDPNAVQAGRFDEVSLIEMGLPTEIIDHLRTMRMVAKTGGWHPDLLADRFGFDSGDALVRTLMAAEAPQVEIEGLTDARMLAEFGELATPDAIAREADKAIHNEARARMIATEANTLARATGQRRVLIETAQQYASEMIARLKVRDVRPGQYTAAAARAGKLAKVAMDKGDLAVAGAEKRNQLVNTLAAKAAMDAKAEAEGTVKKWAEFARRADDKLVKSYDMDMVNAVRAILGQYGIAEKRAKKAAEYLKAVEAYDPEMYGMLRESVDAAEVNAKPYREMTVEEVRNLRDEVDAILHLARRSRQMEVGGDRLDRQDVEDELRTQLETLGIPSLVPGEGQAVTPAESRLAQFKAFVAAATRMENWTERMDAGKPMGPFKRFVYSVIKDAANEYRTAKAAKLKEFRTLVEGIADTLKPQVIAAPELGYTFGKDSGGSAINEILHAVLHTGNESNKRKLLLGRGWATEGADGVVNTARWDGFVARMVAEGKLTREHFDFAQGVWDLLESTKPMAQKTHRDVFGKYFDEVTADEFVDPFGVTRRGGYVPAMVDTRVVKEGELRALADMDNASMSYAFPTTAKGFTKSRVDYNRPLMLDLRTLAQHIDKVLLFSHMEMPVRDVQRVLSGKVGAGINRVDPAATAGLIAPWLNRAARQQVEAPIAGSAGLMRFFSTMRSRAGMAAMFGNLANAVQQVTGFSMAAVKVKPGLLMDAMTSYVKDGKAMAQAVHDASPYMAGRMANEVAIMADAINDILLNPTLLEQGQAWTMRHAYFLQSGIDNVMSPVIWTAAYNQYQAEGYSHEDAVRLADGVVRTTQGSTMPEDISRIEGGNAFVRLFTQFAGYFNMQANLLGTEFANVARDLGLRKGAGKGLYILTMGFLIPAIVGEAVMQVFRGGPGDDDDDGYLDDWMAALFGWAPLRNATAMVPGVGQGVNSLVNAWNSKPYDDRLASSPAVSMLESAAKAPVSVYNAVAEDGSPQKAVRDVATLISMTVGLPGNLAARPIGYLAGVAANDVDPTGPVDAVRGVVTGTASPESK